jgi:ElaB/YqjD/DUF883 family membrane-anchored ribosome-binding protein
MEEEYIMATQSSVHVYLNWAKERLDEMDATLASFESKVGQLRGELRAKAESTLADMRARGDAFRETIKKEREANEAAWARVKAALEADWNAFEASVQKYIDTAGEQIGQQEAAFRASAEAQLKAWQGAIDEFQTSAKGFAADRKADVESALKRMKVEAETAKAKLAGLNRAGNESWSALKTGLAETRAAFDRTNQAVNDAFKRAG